MEVQDPVCGMRFQDHEAAATSTHEGKTYYFCSAHCQKAFEEDPQRFAEREPEE